MIRAQKVDVAIDFHEAELEYPVENTIVAHEKAQEVATMASMVLTAQEFEVPIGMEFSPKALHGLSHREIGDHTPAMSLLFEVAEPMLDPSDCEIDTFLFHCQMLLTASLKALWISFPFSR